jgi:predicted permease
VTLTLALAIGSSTAVYSVVHAVLLRPLPYHASEQIVMIKADVEGFTNVGVLSAPELVDLRERATSAFDGFAGVWGSTGVITEADAEHITFAWVTANTFPLLGVRPIAGRGLNDADEAPNAAPVVLLSEEVWRRRYDADPGAIGRTISIDDRAYTIVGVMPAELKVPRGAFELELRPYDVWMPQTFWENRDQRWLGIIARLREETTLPVADAELAGVAAGLKEAHGSYDESFRLTAVPVHGDLVGGVRPALLALTGAVVFVLLIACTNVAGLLLARGRARQGELAVRRSLGAGRLQLARQLLAESLVLAVVGGAFGVAGAYGLLGLIDQLGPATVPRLDQVALNRPVLFAAVAITLITGLLAGIAPIVQAWRIAPGASLKNDAPTLAAGGRAGVRGGLVAVQIALSVILLTGAGLMLQSIAALRDVDPGFDPSGVVTARVPIAFQGHETGEARWHFYRDLTTRLRALPGVDAAGGISLLPLGGGVLTGPYSHSPETDATFGQLTADYRSVLPGYFDTVRTTIVAGRDFEEADATRNARVVVIDETLARQAWPERSAIGRQIRLLLNPTGNQQEEATAEVIGVVRHARIRDLTTEGLPQIYRPFWLDNPINMFIVARSASNPMMVAPDLRSLTTELGAGRPPHAARLFTEYMDEATAEMRFVTTLLGAFAGIAVALTMVGLYGTVAFLVSSRTREFGVRLALGARPYTIVRLAVTRGLVLTGVGLAVGLAATPLATRALQSTVFGVETGDGPIMAVVAVVLAVIAAGACALPARRATRLDPVRVLRP